MLADPVSNPSPVGEHGEVYKTIYDLPFKNFIDLVVHDDISALIKSGQPSWRLLTAAKASILEDYDSKWIDADQYIVKIMLRDITNPALAVRHLSGIHDLIEAIEPDPGDLQQYLKMDGPSIINRSLFTHLKFDRNDPVSYARDIFYARQRLADLSAFTAVTARWRASISQKLKSKEYTNEYFDSIVSLIFGSSLLKINLPISTWNFITCTWSFIHYQETIHSIVGQQ